MYLVLKSCRADGKSLKAGDVVELKDTTAKTLLEIGRVEVATAKAEEKPVEDRKEKPKRTRKAK